MEMENKTNKKTMIIIAVLCSLLFGLAVAYAALSATMTITFGNITQNVLSWSVGFQSGTVTASKTGSTDVICGDATTTATTVTVANTRLTTINDKCVYKLEIQNTGTLNAKLDAITSKQPTDVSCDTTQTSRMVCGNITYKLTSDASGTTLLNTNNVLTANSGKLDLYLTVEYTGTQTGQEIQQNTAGFTFNYVQQ